MTGLVEWGRFHCQAAVLFSARFRSHCIAGQGCRSAAYMHKRWRGRHCEVAVTALYLVCKGCAVCPAPDVEQIVSRKN